MVYPIFPFFVFPFPFRPIIPQDFFYIFQFLFYSPLMIFKVYNVFVYLLVDTFVFVWELILGLNV